MGFIKIRIAEDFGHLDSNLEKTIEDMFRSMSPPFSFAERTWRPPMDMNETPDEIVILAEVAGIEKDDLEVEVSSKAVRIKGNRIARHCTGDTTYRLAEIQYGPFERILYLPAPIDPEVVSAACTNGLLEIRLAKKPVEKSHKIPISTD
jgi:HSP20 family protein